MTLRIYNTLTRKKELFKEIEKGKVSLYTCGPTVYYYAHIGNLRTFVFGDILRRYLRYKGYAIRHVMNITDVDDKTIRDSHKEGISLSKFTAKYSKAFGEDLDTLNIEHPEVFPKATAHINEMLDIIKDLLLKHKSEKFNLGYIIWSLLIFEIWVLYLKPGTSTLLIGFQALAAMLSGVTAVFLSFESAPSIVYVVLSAAIGYFSARHFFNAYEETHGVQYSWLWAFFSGSLVWILSHWLLFYGQVAQPAVFLSVIGYGLAGLYYLHEHDKLTLMVRRQIIFVVFAVVFVMIAFSNWGDGIIK